MSANGVAGTAGEVAEGGSGQSFHSDYSLGVG